ncbi:MULTISPECIES: hypothetical protein [Pseudomonadati]|uniref:Uncharacterized protein n=1 Tax=Shewanella aestuarii TaxID=1028752 RepID=A0ABT0KZ80_9GAMM|nr:hypothetical protein [Shewanella aestuarii]MCL1116788.1 hypothetical protein [Shewanella aestuarii]
MDTKIGITHGLYLHKTRELRKITSVRFADIPKEPEDARFQQEFTRV